MFRQRACPTPGTQRVRGRNGWIEDLREDLIMLRSEEHWQHVVHRRDCEAPCVTVMEREIAEVGGYGSFVTIV